jgi:hypothetical protein
MSEAPEFAQYVRPDEFAECRNGVMAVPGLMEALWGFVERYEEPMPGEDSWPEGPGRDSLARFWPEMSPEHQAACVEIDARFRAEIEAICPGYWD